LEFASKLASFCKALVALFCGRLIEHPDVMDLASPPLNQHPSLVLTESQSAGVVAATALAAVVTVCPMAL
jgi:hypothetical protein